MVNFMVVSAADEVNEGLMPYQRIIDNLNQEFGASISIPDGDESTVYNNIKELSLEEFEDALRQSYEEIMAIPEIIELKLEDSEDLNDNLIDNDTISPFAADLNRSKQRAYFNKGVVYVDVGCMQIG